MDDERIPGQGFHDLLIPLLEVVDVFWWGLGDLSVVVEVEPYNMAECFWHFEHPRNSARSNDTDQPMIMILQFQSFGNHIKIRVLLPYLFAEIDEERVGIFHRYLRDPIPSNFIVVNHLSLEDLVIGVGRRVGPELFPVHLLLVDAVELRPFEAVVKVDAIYVVLGDNLHDFLE